jgi:protein-S-isoprenylcysteine O-methyltransferase Ste14
MKKLLYYLIGVGIFCGLPLVGWGLNDVKGFLHDPYRFAFIVMMAASTVLVVRFVPREGRSRGEGKRMIQKHKLSLLLIQIISIMIVLLAPFFDHRGIAVFNESPILRLIGLMLALSGFLLMNVSIIALGKQFSIDVTLQDGHQLVTHGPYAGIRHPRYLGIIVFKCGISLVFLSWISLLLVVALTLVLLWRIGDEERLMQQEFKESWAQYRKRTYALIPYLF